MNLSDLMDTVRNALGLGGTKPAAPVAAAPAPRPAPVPPRPAPVTPAPAPAAAAPAAAPIAAATGGATLARTVRAGGHTFAAGTPVKIVTTYGTGSAYTVQLPGLATAKTIEGAAVRAG